MPGGSPKSELALSMTIKPDPTLKKNRRSVEQKIIGIETAILAARQRIHRNSRLNPTDVFNDALSDIEKILKRKL